MKIKSKYIILLFFVAGIWLLFFYVLRINNYIEFQPTIFENNSYNNYELPHGNQSFNENLKIVLDYNRIEYRMDNQGRVLVKRSIGEDKELLLNFTKKALDTLWLDAHKVLYK